MGDYNMSVSPWDVQVGGSHYQKYKIQPMEFFMANKIPYAQAAIIKYVIRYQDKNGVEDLKKARHIIDMLIDEEENRDDGFTRLALQSKSFNEFGVDKGAR
jgi:hypothetical protein